MLRAALLRLAAAAALAAPAVAPADDADDLSVRLYPSKETVQVVFESDTPISHTRFFLRDPDRLVFDIHTRRGDGTVPVINAADTTAARPYIAALRAGRNSPGRLRVVFDLNDDVLVRDHPQEPYGRYRHRLIIEVSPAVPPDPLLDLLRQLSAEQQEDGAAEQPAPEVPAGIPKEDRIRRLLASLNPYIVMLDPGHGGDDPGAVAKSGLLEKDVVLDIALRVKALLDEADGISALLTRETDRFLPLAGRVRKAHRANANLFVSIHADAFHTPTPRGASIFVLSEGGASSRFARELAEQENLSDLIGGVDTDFVAGGESDRDLLRAMSADSKRVASEQLARAVRHHIAEVAHTHGDDIESAGFAVLKSPSIPSVLVETGFLSNPEESALLASGEYRQRIADRIAAAIGGYHRDYHKIALNPE